MPRVRSALLGGLVALAGCATPPDAPLDPDDLPLRGDKPLAPLAKVSFTMADTRGRPFDFRAETDGSIALLFFGYTSCPDVCPVHMATLASAIGQLPLEVRARVRVVFVTVDPRRDTPERLESWLSAFDRTFVGVRGTQDQIAEALAFYRYPEPDFGPGEAGYLVGHPAVVYAFTPDGLGRAMYGPETRQSTWLHDLRLMAAHPWGPRGGAPSGSRPESGTGASPGVLGSAGSVLVLDAYLPEPPVGSTTALYLSLLNTAEATDTLLVVSAEGSAASSIHETVTDAGVSVMRPVPWVALPRGTTVVLRPGGLHGMIEGLSRVPRAGETLPVTVVTALGGSVTVQARVLSYGELPR